MDSFDSMIERYKKELIDAKRRSIYDEINDVIKENTENQMKEYEVEQGENPTIESSDHSENYTFKRSDRIADENFERPSLISEDNDELFNDSFEDGDNSDGEEFFNSDFESNIGDDLEESNNSVNNDYNNGYVSQNIYNMNYQEEVPNDSDFNNDDIRTGRGDGINMDDAAKDLVKDPLPRGNYPDSTGTLRVQVFAADRVYPIPSARVRVTGSGNNRVYFDGLTDSSGIVDNISLPAPSSVYSQEPSLTRPYALYDLLVDRSGYVSHRYLKIPVFSGIKSIQNVQLVPSNNRGNETIVTETEPEELFRGGE